MKGGALFAGYGGIELGLETVLPGLTLEWVCEADPDATAVLEARFPGIPNVGDIRFVGHDPSPWLPMLAAEDDLKKVRRRLAQAEAIAAGDAEPTTGIPLVKAPALAAALATKAAELEAVIEASPPVPVPDWSTVPPVDVLTGGFPCTDVSGAGAGAGIAEGTRSGLWIQFAHAIRQLRPRLVVIENVRGLLSAKADRGADAATPDLDPLAGYLETTDAEDTATDPAGYEVGSGDPDVGDGGDGPVLLRAMGAVLGDLADIGYDAAWRGVPASDVGAPHGRFRVFIVAWPADPDSSGFGPDVSDVCAGQPDVEWCAAADPDSTTGGERGIPAPRQAASGRARADARGRGGAPASDPNHSGWGEHGGGLHSCAGTRRR